MSSKATVVGRAGLVLRALAGEEPKGAGTTELAHAVGLPRPTVHRLLTALEREGLVERDRPTRVWHLGAECFLLGAAATSRHEITPDARDAVSRLARATGDSAFFSVRRGNETVCLLREDGSFPIRSHVLHEGIRFPLGVASAGLVILAFMPEREREDYLAANPRAGGNRRGHGPAQLRQALHETRERGFAVNPGLIVAGSWGLGAAVFDSSGEPRWALSLTGIEARLIGQRQRELGRLLLREAHVLSDRITGRHAEGRTRPAAGRS